MQTFISTIYNVNNVTIHVVYIPFMGMYNTDENHTCR